MGKKLGQNFTTQVTKKLVKLVVVVVIITLQGDNLVSVTPGMSLSPFYLILQPHLLLVQCHVWVELAPWVHAVGMVFLR